MPVGKSEVEREYNYEWWCMWLPFAYSMWVVLPLLAVCPLLSALLICCVIAFQLHEHCWEPTNIWYSLLRSESTYIFNFLSLVTSVNSLLFCAATCFFFFCFLVFHWYNLPQLTFLYKFHIKINIFYVFFTSMQLGVCNIHQQLIFVGYFFSENVCVSFTNMTTSELITYY